MDSEGRIDRVNRSMLELLGYGAEEMLGQRAEVTFEIHFKAPEDSRDVRLWIPCPMTQEHQLVEGERIEGNYVQRASSGQLNRF